MCKHYHQILPQLLSACLILSRRLAGRYVQTRKWRVELVNGGHVVKTLSVGFLADFEQHWRTHGKKVLDTLAEKYPQAVFRWRGGVGKVDQVGNS